MRWWPGESEGGEGGVGVETGHVTWLSLWKHESLPVWRWGFDGSGLWTAPSVLGSGLWSGAANQSSWTWLNSDYFFSLSQNVGQLQTYNKKRNWRHFEAILVRFRIITYGG
jgi:hypothetical protein